MRMKRLFPLLCLLLPIWTLTACEDNAGEEDNSEFTDNWTQRNADYFSQTLAQARQAVAEAKANYGEAWEDHCDWRVFRSYAKMAGGPQTDSICAKVIQRGEGTVKPLYTDSVKVFYIGRLIPTDSYPEGRVFDYSGIYAEDDYVFNPDFSQPRAFAVSNLVEGYSTALMHMHVNDRWVVYIPQELGYGSTAATLLPSYSTLIFDLQLRAIHRKE